MITYLSAMTTYLSAMTTYLSSTGRVWPDDEKPGTRLAADSRYIITV